MSDEINIGVSKGKLKAMGAMFAVAALGTIGTLVSSTRIDSGHFGAKRHFGELVTDTLQPGWHWKVPLVEQIYEFQNNTIIQESNVGTGRNTHEQNMMSAEVRLHHVIDPKKGVLALHINTMGDDNGHDLLDELMDQSFNAVVGERHSKEHMSDHNALLRAFVQNLEWRLAQNNVPISIEAIELLEIQIGDGSNPYRVPVQIRIRRVDSDGQAGWKVENMAGPAAIPVEQSGKVIYPSKQRDGALENDATFYENHLD